MSEFRQISPYEISGNVFDMLNNRWMLITAGTQAGFNMMTASWGGFGVLWGTPVAFCFIRPQRHTFQFMQKEPYFTLSFFDEKYRPALNFCGTKSGRDFDKAKETGLKPVFEGGATYFEQAELVFVLKKLYVEPFRPELFLSPEIEKNYPFKDYHYAYTGKIERVLAK